MRVVIIGSGRVGAGLAVMLTGRGDTVAVIDKDPRAFERLGEGFPGQAVEGIGFDRDVLERAGVARADTVVAATGDDEDNLVVSLLAKHSYGVYGVPRVVARVNNPKNAWLFTEDWGVDTAVSAPAILTRLLDTAVGSHIPGS